MIFNFHSYATLVHKLTYNRTNHENMHVHGYREKGNINTPFELAIINEVDRYTLAIDVIDRVPALGGLRRSCEELAQGSDHREHPACARGRHRLRRDPRVDLG